MQVGDRLARVTGEIRVVLEEAEVPASYAEMLAAGLSQEGKPLSEHPNGRWSLLLLAACEVASRGKWRAAVPAAAAMESLAAALEVIDDIQDGDPNPVVDRFGPNQALNAATGLVVLAHDLVLRLSLHRVPATTVVQAGRELTRAALRVGGGQSLDLAHELRDDVSEEEVMDVAARKSGALLSCACRVGARVGAGQIALVDALGRFGWHLGIASQLANDLRDSLPGAPPKSDIYRGKKTLPLVAAAAFGLPPEWRHQPDGLDQLRERLARSGALHYTWAAADLHFQRARDVLSEVGASRPVQPLQAVLERGH